MNKKSTAQVFLESFDNNKVKIECKLAERQFWSDLSLSITSQLDGERVQSSGVKDKMAKARDFCMDIENDILSQVEKLAAEQKKVTQVLEQLKSKLEYKVAHCKYVQGKTFEDIAEEMGKSYTAITTIHGRALESVSKILDRQ